MKWAGKTCSEYQRHRPIATVRRESKLSFPSTALWSTEMWTSIGIFKAKGQPAPMPSSSGRLHPFKRWFRMNELLPSYTFKDKSLKETMFSNLHHSQDNDITQAQVIKPYWAMSHRNERTQPEESIFRALIWNALSRGSEWTVSKKPMLAPCSLPQHINAWHHFGAKETGKHSQCADRSPGVEVPPTLLLGSSGSIWKHLALL